MTHQTTLTVAARQDEASFMCPREVWHEELKRFGDFPPVEPISDLELKTLKQVRGATPDAVGPRVVVSFDGKPIWFRKMKQGIIWTC